MIDRQGIVGRVLLEHPDGASDAAQGSRPR
jgi:hypothetical protein